MPTIQQNLAQVRILLDEPSPQTPSDRVLFEILSNQVQHHQSQLQNSSAQWSVAEWPLTVSEGTEDYLVTAADFGKPFLVYTEDPSDQYLPRVGIPFAMMQNTDMFYAGPRQVYSTNTNIFTAAVISFYRSSDAWYARVTPVPGGSAEYHVWYETAPAAPDALSSTPGLSPFHHLVRVQTALSALPYAGWGDVRSDAVEVAKANAWTRKTQALAMALGRQEAQFQKEFSTYLATIMQPGVERRQGFGDGYLDEWGGGGFLAPNSWGSSI